MQVTLCKNSQSINQSINQYIKYDQKWQVVLARDQKLEKNYIHFFYKKISLYKKIKSN